MPTLREQVKKLRDQGNSPERIREAMENAFGIPAKDLAAFLDTDVKELKRKTDEYKVSIQEMATSPVEALTRPSAQEVAETPEEKQIAAEMDQAEGIALPEAVTPEPAVDVAVPAKPEPKAKGLIPYQGTVRVPLLEETGLVEPYKGKETVLEVGPSMERLAPMAVGAVEGIAPFVATAVESVGSLFKGPTTEQFDEAYLRREGKRLNRIAEVAKQFDEAVEEKRERVKNVRDPEDFSSSAFNFLENTGTDIRDVMLGLATIVNETTGFKAIAPYEDKQAAAAEFGKQLGAGVASVTGAVFAEGSPEYLGLDAITKSFISRPLTTILTILPVVQAAKGSAALARPAAQAESAFAKMWRKADVDIPFEKVSEAAQNTKAYKALRRFFEEPTEMPTQEATAIAEEAIDVPREVRSRIEAQTERLGKRIAEGKVERPKVAEAALEEVAEGVYNPEKVEQYIIERGGTPEEVASYKAASAELKESVGKWGDDAEKMAEVKTAHDPAIVQELTDRGVSFYQRILDRNIEAPISVLRAAMDQIAKELGIELTPTQLETVTKNAIVRHNTKAAFELAESYISGTVRRPPQRYDRFNFDEAGKSSLASKAREILTRDVIDVIADNKKLNEALPEQISPKHANIARTELAEMGERIITGRERVGYRSGVPEVERVIDFVDEQVKSVYPSYAEAVQQATGKASTPRSGSQLSRRRIAQRLLETLEEETMSLMRDKAVAKAATKALVAEAKAQKVPANVIRKMVKQFREYVADNASIVSSNRFPEFYYKGQRIFGKDNLVKVFSELPDTLKKRAQGFATSRIGAEIAAEIEGLKQFAALQNEYNRFIKPENVGSPDAYAVQMATEVLVNGQTRPLIMPFAGQKIASSLRNAKARLAKVLSEKTDASPLQMQAAIESLAKYIEQFEPMEKVNKQLKAFSETLTGTEIQPKLANAHALPEFNNSVYWDMASKNGVFTNNPAIQLIVNVGNLFKRNVVARATASLINNNISNLNMLAVRRGVTPIQVFYDITTYGKTLYDYLRGADDPINAALDRQGLFSSNEVKQDFTKMAKASGKVPGEAIAKAAAETPPGRAISAIQDFFEKTYTKLGDDLFKGAVGSRRMNKALSQLQQQGIGYYSEFWNSPSSKIRLTKTGPSRYKAEKVSNTGRLLEDLGTITDESPQFYDILAKDGLNEGNNLFVDYGRVGNWTKILRSLPVTNLASSFHTWYWKGLDLPFKKGFVYKTLIETDTIPSNDPAIVSRNIRQDLSLQARRAIMANSMVGVAREQGDVGKPLSYSPSRDEISLVVAATNPNYVLQYNLGSRDYSDPTRMGIKFFQKMLSMGGADDAEIKRLFPPRDQLNAMSDKEWNRLQRQRRLFLKQNDGTVLSPKEALELVGIGGSIILNFYDYIRETEKQGKVVDLAATMRNFGKVLIGSNLARAADIVVAGGVEAGILPEEASTYTRLGKGEQKRGYRAGQLSPNQTDFIQYAVKEAFGIGWNSIMYLTDEEEFSGKKMPGAVQRYLSGLSAELKANLVKPLDDRIARLYSRLKIEQDPTAQQDLREQLQELSVQRDTLEQEIETQKDLYEERFLTGLKDLQMKQNKFSKQP